MAVRSQTQGRLKKTKKTKKLNIKRLKWMERTSSQFAIVEILLHQNSECVDVTERTYLG